MPCEDHDGGGDADDFVGLSECVDSFFEAGASCRLPWRSHRGLTERIPRTCESAEELGDYLRFYSKVLRPLSLRGIFKHTGCYSRCRFREFDLSLSLSEEQDFTVGDGDHDQGLTLIYY